MSLNLYSPYSKYIILVFFYQFLIAFLVLSPDPASRKFLPAFLAGRPLPCNNLNG